MAISSSLGKRDHGVAPITGRRASSAAVACAVALAVAWAAGASWAVAALLAWEACAAVYLVWVWSTIAPADEAATERLAASEDSSRAATEWLLLTAGVASLIAVGFVLAQASRAGSLDEGLLTALAVASVLLAWTTVHTIFTLRYARLYYAPPVGGIDFPDNAVPEYSDFAYIAFTIGMTFQVADTNLARRSIRRTVLHHGLLPYLFGTVIVAITVSSVASILLK